MQQSHSSQLTAFNIVTEEMTRKILILTVVWCVIELTSAGIFDESHGHEQHHTAKSYLNFHGPVEGPAYEIKIPQISHHHDEHDHGHHHTDYVLDYVAHPSYKYSYGVEDHKHGDFHTQKEETDEHGVKGEYTILEPGGRYRTVKYTADKNGFHADVDFHGKNEHTYTKHEEPKVHQVDYHKALEESHHHFG